MSTWPGATPENMLYMVDRFGKMYNGNLTVFQNRSQPPFLSMMIASVYRSTGDKEWRAKCCRRSKKSTDSG